MYSSVAVVSVHASRHCLHQMKCPLPPNSPFSSEISETLILLLPHVHSPPLPIYHPPKVMLFTGVPPAEGESYVPQEEGVTGVSGEGKVVDIRHLFVSDTIQHG